MPYTFELTFTGLCVFTFTGDKRTPTEVNALLVNATHHTGHHKHLPLLAYNPRNLERRPVPEHRLVPGADGSQTALQDLIGRVIEITTPTPPSPPRPLTAQWRPAAVANLPMRPDRNDPSQEEWLDWAMALQRMNKETPEPNAIPPFMGLKGANVTARLRVTEGNLKARGFPRQTNLDYAVWDFKVPPAIPAEFSYSMANSIVLTLYNVPDRQSVVLSGAGFSVTLRQFQLPDGNLENLVRASITNLPEEPTPQLEADVLSHFKHFYDLVDFPPPPPALRLPHRRGATITSDNSFCPPTTHSKAE